MNRSVHSGSAISGSDKNVLFFWKIIWYIKFNVEYASLRERTEG